MVRFVLVGLLAGLALTLAASAAHADDDDMLVRPEPIHDWIKAHSDLAAVDLPGIGHTSLYWERGPTLEAHDGDFKLHLGGRLQYDAIWYGKTDDDVAAAIGDTYETGSEWRRVQIFAEGWIGQFWYFKARFDAAEGDGATFQDIYADWRGPHDRSNGRIPRIRLGQYKQPVSLEMLTSSGTITFLEYSLPVQALTPFRNLGVGFLAKPFSEHLSIEAGFFVLGVDEFSDVDRGSGYDFAARVVWHRISGEDGCDVLHFGVSGNVRTGTQSAQLKTTPETNLGPEIVNTGELDVSQGGLLDLEALVIKDRFSAQAEYLVSRGRVGGRDADTHGGYLQLSWFLTPCNCRRYGPDRSVFRRLEPQKPVRLGANEFGGAWQLAARASYVDLDDRSVRGGRVFDATVGLNWWLTDQARVTFNYVYTRVWNAWGDPRGDGVQHAFGMRLGVEW